MENTEKGASTVEYALLLSLGILVSISAISQVGYAVNDTFYEASFQIAGGIDDGGGGDDGSGGCPGC